MSEIQASNHNNFADIDSAFAATPAMMEFEKRISTNNQPIEGTPDLLNTRGTSDLFNTSLSKPTRGTSDLFNTSLSNPTRGPQEQPQKLNDTSIFLSEQSPANQKEILSDHASEINNGLGNLLKQKGVNPTRGYPSGSTSRKYPARYANQITNTGQSWNSILWILVIVAVGIAFIWLLFGGDHSQDVHVIELKSPREF